MKYCEHFQKILYEENKNGECYIVMPYYERKKIKFDEHMWLVKNNIKSLLLSLKKLNEVGYVHGDIKPNNYINNNPKNYYLIDFNASDKINKKNNSRKIENFPYMPPEKNKYISFYNNKITNVKKLFIYNITIYFKK